MRTNCTRNDDNTVLLTAVLEGAPWKTAQKKALNQAAARMDLKGFRKGKTPSALIRKTVGADTLRSWAAEDLAGEVLQKLEDEYDIIALGRPVFRMEEMDDEQATFVFTVEVAPEVPAGDWKNLGLVKEEVRVDEKDLSDALDAILTREGEEVLLDEETPAQWGDVLVFDFSGAHDGEVIPGASAENYSLKLGAGTQLEGFEEGLIGVLPGETREVKVTFPQDYIQQDLAGKEGVFTVTVHEGYRPQKAELTDEFAAGLEGYQADTAEGLKEEVAALLLQNKTDAAEKRFRRDLYSKLSSTLEQELPESMVEAQIDDELRDLDQNMRSLGLDGLKGYLEATGSTLDAVRDTLRPEAEEKARTGLVLDAIAREEGFEPSDEELAAFLNLDSDEPAMTVEEMHARLSMPHLRRAWRRMKAEDLLFQANGGEAGENSAKDAQTE